MLYSELLNLTEDKCTYEQYEEINEVYMNKESMTKRQAASLWKRRYAEKKLKPLPKELREIKQVIRDLQHEKEWAELQEKRIRENYAEKIAQFNPDNSWERWSIENLEKRRESAIYNMWESMGNDVAINIIYEDGSQCVASGVEIVAGEIMPKMQHIVYANYSDGWTTYDTLTGCLDDVWNMEEDADFEAREQYFSDIEIRFETEWGRKQKAA